MSTAYVVMKTSPANVVKLGILSPANVVIGIKRKKKFKKTYKMFIKSTAYVLISLRMSTAYVVMKTSHANVVKLGILSPANVVIGMKRKKKLKKTYKMLIKSTAYVVILRMSV